MEEILNLIRSIPNSPRGLLDFVTHLFLARGYLVVFLGAALDNFGLPASGDVVMFAGGWLANTERAEFTLIMLAGFAGALLSDNAVYWIGRFGGRPLIERLTKTRVLHFMISEKNLARVERYFDRHGGKTVFIGRFGPGLRSMTPLFAGVTRMKYYRFFPYNLAAVVVWAVAYSLLGYLFGQYWDDLLSIARSAGFLFVALLTAILLVYIYRRRAARKRS
jgi:membrane-associated protein